MKLFPNFFGGFDKKMINFLNLSKKHPKIKKFFFDICWYFAIIGIHCIFSGNKNIKRRYYEESY